MPGVLVVLSSMIVFSWITLIFLGIHFDIFMMSPLLIILPSLHIPSHRSKKMFNICLEESIWILNLIDSPKQKKYWRNHIGERSLTVCKVLSLVSCHFAVTPAQYYSHCTNGDTGLKSLSGSRTQSKNTDLFFWFPVLSCVVFSNKTYIRANVILKL